MAQVIKKYKEGSNIPTKKETSKKESSSEAKTTEEPVEAVAATQAEQTPQTQVEDNYTIHYNDKEYDPVWIRDYIEKNVNTFINNENMTQGQAEKFRNTIKDVILPSIDAKVLDFSDPYTLNVPIDNSSDGYYNKAGSGIFSYDITDDNKAGMIAATRYLRSLLSSPDAIAKKPKEAYNGDKVLIKALAEKLGNGSATAFKSVWEAYTPKERRKALQEVLGSLDYDNIFKLYNFDETNTKDAAALRLAVTNLQEALKNDKAKDDKLESSTFAAAGKVGISLLKSLLYGEEKPQAPATPIGAEGGTGTGTGTNTGTETNTEQGISQQDIQAVNNVNSIFSEIEGGTSSQEIQVEQDSKYVRDPDSEYTNSGVQLQKDIDDLNKNPLKVGGKEYRYGDLIEYTNKYIFKNLVNGNLRTTDSSSWKPVDRKAIKLYFYTLQQQNPGAQFVYAYYEPETKKVIVADIKNNKFIVGGINKDQMYAFPEGKKVIDKILSDNNLSYDKYLQIMNSVSSNKKGGTLRRKYLEGGKAAEYAKQIKEGISADNAAKKPKGMDQKTWDAKTKLMADEDGIELSGTDITRLTSLAQDIVALGASFAGPHGMAAAGVLGITSALTDLGADIFDDSVTKGEVVTNLIANLGLGIAGAIPGGKAGSIGAKLVKLGPKLAKALMLYGGFEASKDVIQVLQKGNNVGYNNLSKDDWNKLIRAAQLFIGGKASTRVAKARANALQYTNSNRTTKTVDIDSVTLKGKFKKPTGNNTAGIFKSNKELKFDLTNPEHAKHWQALQGKKTNTERVAYLKEKGLIADEAGQKIRGTGPKWLSNWLFGNETGMFRTRTGHLYNWEEFKAANPNWKTIIKGGKEGRDLFIDREIKSPFLVPDWLDVRRYIPGMSGRIGLLQERDMVRGYLENLRHTDPNEYLRAIREIDSTIRTKRWKIFKKMDERAAKAAKRHMEWFPKYFENFNIQPTTPTGSPIASIASPYNPQESRLYRQTVLYEKRGGILSSDVQFAKQVLSYKTGGKSSNRKSSTKRPVIDYSTILNSPEYKEAWKTILDELDKNPNSDILKQLNDLQNSWVTNSNALFGSAGYTGTVKKGNGEVTSRRKIFNNTALGKAINTIIKANDGLDDYFGPLENTRHFGKKEHLSQVSKIVEDLIAEGQKNNKYKNLKSLKVVDNNGVLGFQLNTSGDASTNTSTNTGNVTAAKGQTGSGTSVDVGTPLATKSNKKVNINLPQLYADIRYKDSVNAQKRINDLYHTYKIGFEDPTRQSFIYNDNYSPIKNMEQQAASNLSTIQRTASSTDQSVNNAALLEGIRTNNKALADARVQADANIRENNKLNQAIADANAKEAVETANANREKLNKFNNQMVDIDVSNALALHNSKDRYLAEQQQLATQKQMLANAMDYSKYTEAQNAQVFHEQSELAKLERKELADLAERLKASGKTGDEIYNDPEFIALSNSFQKQMHEIVSRHRMNSADYLGSLISFNPYTWVRPDNVTFDVSYTPSFKSSATKNKKVTVGKRGLKLSKGGEAKYSYDKAKEAYLKFLRDDYKQVSKRNAKVLHGQYK